MKEMLARGSVQRVDGFSNWEEAIRGAGKPLVDNGSIEPRYLEGIIENTYALGPYYVLAEDIALLHARPEQGVLRNQLGVTVTRQPVSFSEDGKHDARLLVTLAATDGEQHIGVMQQLAELFMDEEKVQAILHAEDADAIYSLFIQGDASAQSGGE